MGLGSYLVALFGVEGWLADLDAGRRYLAEGNTLYHTYLDWASGPGFGAVARRLEFDKVFVDAGTWRQRYSMGLFRAMTTKATR